MKTCTKCKTEYEAVAENFSRDENRKDGFQPWWGYRDAHKTEAGWYRKMNEEKSAEYRRLHKKEAKVYYSDSHATVRGYLRRCYNHMNWRCAKRKEYVKKGIRNKFETYEHLISYVVEVLEVDPRGKDCHRIDNDGNYEVGNIEFLTPEDHVEKHKIRL